MTIPVLLVCTATRVFEAARVPRALARAGFEVTLLAPRGTLAEKSRFVSRIGHTPDDATPSQWVFAFAATVKATSPRLVVPGDDHALRLLQMLVLSPSEFIQPALQRELASLVSESLGAPEHYRTSVDKTLLAPAAKALGVPMPPHAIVTDPAEAEAFAADRGYPIVLQRGHSSAGDGVELCSDRHQLARAFAALKRSADGGFQEPAGDRLLAQAYVAGPAQSYPAAAWKGALLAGYAGVRVVGGPDPKAPPTVNRYRYDARLRDLTSRLAVGFGISGFFSPEFVVDNRTGEPYLLDINRQVVREAHGGGDIGVDHWLALHAALQGTAAATRADLDEGEEHVTVHFPQEWLRDPQSHWLRECPVDVPWDDPELIEAMLEPLQGARITATI